MGKQKIASFKYIMCIVEKLLNTAVSQYIWISNTNNTGTHLAIIVIVLRPDSTDGKWRVQCICTSQIFFLKDIYIKAFKKWKHLIFHSKKELFLGMLLQKRTLKTGSHTIKWATPDVCCLYFQASVLPCSQEWWRWVLLVLLEHDMIPAS